jgi:hypothetical protein
LNSYRVTVLSFGKKIYVLSNNEENKMSCAATILIDSLDCYARYPSLAGNVGTVGHDSSAIEIDSLG